MLPTIATGNVASAIGGGYEVANSCRFNDGDSAYMHKTPAGAGNLRTFTISLWIKRGALGTRKALFNNTDGDGQEGVYYDFQADDTLLISDYGTGSYDWNLETTQVFRDTSAWYHIVIAVDTEQAVAANRVKLYVNGSQITAFDAANYPSEDADTLWNTTDRFEIGSYNGTGNFFDGYLAEVVHIDGLQLAATSFGEFDEDSPTIWKPIDVSGLTFGTNGFYLDFEDSSNLGNDANGGTDLTEVNLAAADSASDTPTNNFATMNPLDNYWQGSTFSYGNNRIATASSPYTWNTASIGLSAGLWYFETKVVTAAGSNYQQVGVSSRPTINATTYLGDEEWTYGYNGFNGKIYNNGDNSYGDTHTTGDIIGVYLDLTNSKLYFAKNGTIQNSGTGFDITAVGSTDTGLYFPAAGDWGSSYTATFDFNFGGSPAFAVSSGNADANGYGSFEYDPSDGGSSSFDSAAKDFLAICTKNLAEYG